MNDRQLRRRFLQAAAKLRKEHTVGWVSIQEMELELGMEPSESGFINGELVEIAQYYAQKGYLKKQVAGYGAFTVTSLGIDQAEIEAEQARLREPEDFLKTLYLLSNRDPSTYVYWENIAPEMGWSADSEDDQALSLAIADRLKQRGLVAIEVEEGGIYRITSDGMDRVEGNTPNQQQGSNTFNFYAAVENSIVGTQTRAELTNNFDFRSLEQRIEREGGEDKEELRMALEQVERLLERGEYLDRGALARFSEVMERHSWFTGAIVSALLGFATQVVS